MNKFITKSVLTGDKFMVELHLKQEAGFTYSARGPFIKHRERIQNLEKQKVKSIYIEMN